MAPGGVVLVLIPKNGEKATNDPQLRCTMETIPDNGRITHSFRHRRSAEMSRAAVVLCVVLGSLLANASRAYPQTTMHGAAPGDTFNLIGNDPAVLDSGETKKDIPCTVTPVNPVLGFDLRM